MIGNMVKFTNLFGRRSAKKTKAVWKDVSKAEMEAFIGILIAAGRLHQNNLNIDFLWSSDDVWSPSFYKLAMSKNRFKTIFNNWRFDDKTTRNRRLRKSRNKLEPINSFYQDFVKRCVQNYNPGENLTVDERLCVFRGKFFWNLYCYCFLITIIPLRSQFCMKIINNNY